LLGLHEQNTSERERRAGYRSRAAVAEAVRKARLLPAPARYSPLGTSGSARLDAEFE
jgi:hypothetical protein